MHKSSNVKIHLCWWGLVIIIACLIKGHYRYATEAELQWMLAPLTTLLQLISSFEFDQLANGVYLNTEHGIAIVKGCSGINFMVMSLLGFTFSVSQLIEQYNGIIKNVFTHAKKPSQRYALMASYPWLILFFSLIFCLTMCIGASWGVTIIINSIRILLVMYLYISEVTILGIGTEELHRLTGIMVFFPALLLQIHLGKINKSSKTPTVAALIYLGILVFLPLLTGTLQTNLALFFKNSLFVSGAIIFFLIIIKLAKNAYPTKTCKSVIT